MIGSRARSRRTLLRELGVCPPRLGWRSLISEAVSGILQRPGRTVLTSLGAVLGIGALVAILGLTATASGQISDRFNALTSTEVVLDNATADQGQAERQPFPADADRRVGALNGVKSAGVFWPIPADDSATARGLALPGQQADAGVSVLAASPGLLRAVLPTISAGRLFDDFHDMRREHVAVLGDTAAKLLGIHTLAVQPAIFVDDIPFTVIGIVSDVQREPSLLNAVLVPRRTAEGIWGAPDSVQVRMIVDTDLGAARVVAGQVAVDLRPDNPSLFTVSPPLDPHGLRDQVQTDLGSLLYLMAGICLIIGTVGIANTTLVAVLERTGEIGLRRALGARPRHIGGQFLLEAAIVGTIGGLIGTCLGLMTTVAVALVQHWTPLMQPAVAILAPFLGTATGLIAGLYPALRAAAVEPVRALQR